MSRSLQRRHFSRPLCQWFPLTVLWFASVHARMLYRSGGRPMLRRKLVAVGLLGLSIASIAAKELQPPVPAPSKAVQQEHLTTKRDQSNSKDGLTEATHPLPVEVRSPTHV